MSNQIKNVFYLMFLISDLIFLIASLYSLIDCLVVFTYLSCAALLAFALLKNLIFIILISLFMYFWIVVYPYTYICEKGIKKIVQMKKKYVLQALTVSTY